MKTGLVITDLTRMYQGRVCIAGYNSEHQCVRPILPPPGISEKSLLQNGKPIIYPFSLVEIDLIHADPEPPHTEDYFYNPESIAFVRQVHDRRTVLGWSLFESVGDVFEQPVHSDFGFYVMSCQGPRSLGTIRPVEIEEAIYEIGFEGTWDYRLIFIDGQSIRYRLKITDLTWQYYCHSLRGEDRDQVKIAQELTSYLRSCEVFLRIGLARGWEKFPDRCYLQITGIYTFPDYLDGKTFIDFVS